MHVCRWGGSTCIAILRVVVEAGGEELQVVMDIAGCFITCATCTIILDQLAKGVQPLTA